MKKTRFASRFVRALYFVKTQKQGNRNLKKKKKVIYIKQKYARCEYLNRTEYPHLM